MLKIILIAFYVVMNLTGFITMLIDKRRAINNKWRISERNLLLIAFIGGGLGSYIGMRLFKHKTRHLKFIILLPVFLVINLLTVIYLVKVIY